MELSELLGTGLNRRAVEAIVGLCEAGVNPTVLAHVVSELQAATSTLDAEEQEEEDEEQGDHAHVAQDGGPAR